MFNTPILFLVFNRPEQTRKVFERIKAIEPKYLYVAADGPRESLMGEADICRLTREIATAIDWDCKLYVLFRDQNLGCGRAVSEGISWFFENVEEGIILEDDCLVDNSFFSFASALLREYRDVEQVMHISANGLMMPDRTLVDYVFPGASYFFAQYPLVWGWATWRRAWKKYDFNMQGWKTDGERLLAKSFQSIQTLTYWNNEFEAVFTGRLDTWDYQWLYTLLKNEGLSIIPRDNLVENIGFGVDATHYFNPEDARTKMKAKQISRKLKHPKFIKLNKNYTLTLEEEIFGLKRKKVLYRRALDKIMRKLKGK